MKKVLFLLFMFAMPLVASEQVTGNCRMRGIRLWGKVRIKSTNADFKVREVGGFADICVFEVDSNPKQCGEWQMVTYDEDFTIQFVSHGEDFTIKYVDYPVEYLD